MSHCNVVVVFVDTGVEENHRPELLQVHEVLQRLLVSESIAVVGYALDDVAPELREDVLGSVRAPVGDQPRCRLR
jgi:hypothetical protein